MKGDSGPSSLEQSKGVRVVLLIAATVPAARKPETVTSQVNRIQSSPLSFFFLSHFIRDASSHTEQLPSFYFCPFFFFFFCRTLSGRFRTSSKQYFTKFKWTEIFYRIYQVGKYLRRSLGSPLCLKLGQGWTQTSSRGFCPSRAWKSLRMKVQQLSLGI